MSLPTKIMLGAFILLVGWLWYYLFFRQFIYNFSTAFPTLKKMRSADADLISPNAKRYTVISVFASFMICAVIAAIVIFLCRKHYYFIIAFFAGALLSFILSFNKLSPKSKVMFEAFCSAYYRFIPDDELRTAMYNKKIGQMKVRLHEMGISDDFIPEFKE